MIDTSVTHVHTEKAWPIAGGAGFGAGMAFADCQHDFSHAGLLSGKVHRNDDAIMTSFTAHTGYQAGSCPSTDRGHTSIVIIDLWMS